ncbi:hypothetical protein D6764_02175 [Candidatus Woesearchaeota archaeon]|nr:MAG: hypothetical protein D6764_02175 [Candidatus Woesearchaeota archaeon]
MKKELEALHKKVAQQERQIEELNRNLVRGLDAEYLSQIFITREEYPVLQNLSDRLVSIEKRLAKSESALKEQLNVIESEAVEQRKIIEKLQRRTALNRVLPVASIIRTLAAMTGSGRKK